MAAVNSHDDIIVRVEEVQETGHRSHYRVFSGIQALFAHMQNAGDDCTFHEITRISTDPHAPAQRLYFDIDSPRETWGDMDGRTTEDNIVKSILEAASQWRPVTRALVATSSDYINKVSVHVIFPDFVFEEHTALKRVAMKIRSYLQPWLANCTDVLYKKNQGLRLLGSHKAGTTRVKRAMGPGWPEDPIEALALSTIHAYGSAPTECLDCHAPPPFRSAPLGSVGGAELDRILTALEEAEKHAAITYNGGIPPIGGAYRERSTERHDNGRVVTALTRIAPSCCIICKRTHESENVTIVQKNGVYRVHCFRDKQYGKNRGVVIFTDPSSVNIAPPPQMLPVPRPASDDADYGHVPDEYVHFEIDSEMPDQFEYATTAF